MATTVGDVVKWVTQCAGYDPQVQYDAGMPTTMKYRILDCSKAHSLLGWKPLISSEDGTKRTVEWWNESKGWWKK